MLPVNMFIKVGGGAEVSSKHSTSNFLNINSYLWIILGCSPVNLPNSGTVSHHCGIELFMGLGLYFPLSNINTLFSEEGVFGQPEWLLSHSSKQDVWLWQFPPTLFSSCRELWMPGCNPEIYAGPFNLLQHFPPHCLLVSFPHQLQSKLHDVWRGGLTVDSRKRWV